MLGKVFTIAKYALIAGVLFIFGTRILVNAIPYTEIVTSLGTASKTITNSIIESLTFRLPDSEVTPGTRPTEQPVENQIVVSVASIVINLVVVAIISGVQILFVLSIISAVLGTLILSQSRSIVEMLMLAIGFAIPRQRKNWGIVFDQSTNLPIPFATIRITKVLADGKTELVFQGVADLDGRYRAYIKEKQHEYFIEVTATGYQNRWKKLAELPESEIIEDFPLTKIGGPKDTWRTMFFNFRPILTVYFINYLYLLSIAALLICIYNAVKVGNIESYIGTIVYGFSVAWNILALRDRRALKRGRVLDQETNAPIEGVFIRVYEGSRSIASKVTDNFGEVKLDVDKGKYVVEAQKPGYEVIASENQSTHRLLLMKIDKRGFLSRNILMKRVENKSKEQKPAATTPTPTSQQKTTESPAQQTAVTNTNALPPLPDTKAVDNTPKEPPAPAEPASESQLANPFA